jgi:hypothetical protein
MRKYSTAASPQARFVSRWAVVRALWRRDLSEIERQLGNVIGRSADRLAGVLGVSIAKFFVLPGPGEAALQSLPSGRHSKA